MLYVSSAQGGGRESVIETSSCFLTCFFRIRSCHDRLRENLQSRWVAPGLARVCTGREVPTKSGVRRVSQPPHVPSAEQYEPPRVPNHARMSIQKIHATSNRSRVLKASQGVFRPTWGHVKDALLALARYQNPRHVMIACCFGRF